MNKYLLIYIVQYQLNNIFLNIKNIYNINCGKYNKKVNVVDIQEALLYYKIIIFY